MSKKGMIPRDKKEVLAKELLIKCHDWLKRDLKVDTNLVLSRECNWGKNAFHAGCYVDARNEVRMNFRNFSGASIYDFLEVLGHEMRHAVQYSKGFLERTRLDGHVTRNSKRYVSGTWKGEHLWRVAYVDAPWEVDARKYQAKYADKVIKALGITNKELNVTTEMGIQNNSDQRATYLNLNKKYKEGSYVTLSNTWLKDKKKKQGGGITFVLTSDLPKNFNWTNEDKDWLYSKGQDLLKFMPWVKVSSEYGGFSIEQLVS